MGLLKYKKPVKKLQITDEEIYQFMLDQFGGKDKVLRAMCLSTIRESRQSTTVGELLAKAKLEGWVRQFMDTTIKDIKGPQKKPRLKGKKGIHDKVKGKIIQILGENGDLSKRQLMALANEPTCRIVRALSDLKRQGKIKISGTRRLAKYSLI